MLVRSLDILEHLFSYLMGRLSGRTTDVGPDFFNNEFLTSIALFRASFSVSDPFDYYQDRY
ncbi:MAG: hypothetical protein HeimC2_31990 [Candidatus Heimdallarchaeota archaeon LC_2]|nr:MAG: hypothetical protein HeimC2_31990 [Candidatus Heimdallarchaeota archaeon LC_2]